MERITPRQYYQSQHPHLFSDSTVAEVTELDRSLREYHLYSLTSRSQEADFERFARCLCERCICPNLLPSTGPSGGGDSKADAETYPVADALSLVWYSGIGREAAQERWAFAFSAKADWLPKVKSDVKKIVETGRGYKKAFFVTNQSISAKRRASVEDDLRRKYEIDARFLDLNWIVEQIFAGQHEDLAISELKITALATRSKRSGPNDVARSVKLEEVEAQISQSVQDQLMGPILVDDAIKAASLRRSLEKPRIAVQGSYARADKLALQHGSLRQQVESAYQWAWTLFWWHEDYAALLQQYEVVESRVKDSDNVYDLECLSNLWNLVFWHAPVEAQKANEIEWLSERTRTLRQAFQRLVNDTERPSVSLQATAHLLQIDLSERVRARTQIDDIFEAFSDLIERAQGLVSFPMQTLVGILTVIGQVVDESSAYNALFDTIVELSARREGEVRAARLLLERGEQYMNQKRPAKAIAMVGQALSRLYKHETRSEIVYALYLCGLAYERLGLVWAARATHLSGASIAANDFWKHETISPGFAACVNRLKLVEARLGRIPHILAWQELDLTMRAIAKAKGLSFPDSEKEEAAFDALLARLFLRTPPDLLESLSRLPDVLDDLQLYTSAGALLFLFGYPDRLAAMGDGPDDDADKLAQEIYDLGADVVLPEAPEYLDIEDVSLSSRILGCHITAACSLTPPCIEVAEWILTILESFLASVDFDHAFAHEPELTIKSQPADNAAEGTLVCCNVTELLGRPQFTISCKLLDPYEISVETQDALGGQAAEIALSVLDRAIRFRDFESDLKSLFERERVMERAVSFTGTPIAVRNVLGSSPKFRITQWCNLDKTNYL